MSRRCASIGNGPAVQERVVVGRRGLLDERDEAVAQPGEGVLGLRGAHLGLVVVEQRVVRPLGLGEARDPAPAQLDVAPHGRLEQREVRVLARAQPRLVAGRARVRELLDQLGRDAARLLEVATGDADEVLVELGLRASPPRAARRCGRRRSARARGARPSRAAARATRPRPAASRPPGPTPAAGPGSRGRRPRRGGGAARSGRRTRGDSVAHRQRTGRAGRAYRASPHDPRATSRVSFASAEQRRRLAARVVGEAHRPVFEHDAVAQHAAAARRQREAALGERVEVALQLARRDELTRS